MQTAISAIFVFLLVILLHELGHFAVAKMVGIKVNEFAIGMGPTIFKTKKGETKYSLRALPIGGYVSMEGEDENSNDPRSFNKAPVLSRMGVIVAGAFMNFVLAIIVLSIVSFNIGVQTTIVEDTTKNSPAEISGILSGDKISAINGVNIDSWEDIINEISSKSNKEEIKISILRNKEKLDITMIPTVEDGRTVIGIKPKTDKSIGLAIKGGFEKTGVFLNSMFDFVKMVFKGEVSTKDLSGPVGVINVVGEASKMGFTNLLLILGFISVNLGFFNLLPIPALDGSRLVFLFIELIRGKPINPEKENLVHMVGFFLLIGLMIVVTYRDLIRINIF
ncbi:RIP metalloprotease RseP [Tissierella creatinophila]|uniref:Zinc metalloprotease n=1 Tax=Tissierella creatinophila DSM 6911 TaxID=1123403 RepID=A0A1U7M3A0_TISCR|nr:RIP metalloprotease RseP [Tissierella creatinophila]OLS01756.1 regulator of sigma-W protease RasP [Tissierella creatinophila DSM 6911]